MSIIDHVREYIESRKYIYIVDLVEYLRRKDIQFEDETVKKYLYRLKEAEEIYDAGRKWYSTIEKQYTLKTEPVREFTEKLDQKFPFLEFSVWSTRQISSHYHHLPGKFLTFIYSEKQTEDAVRDFLVDEGLHVYLDPKKGEIDKNFRFERDTYIIRSAIQKEPKKKHFARIEKILVDLFVEMAKFNFMDEAEYEHVFLEVVANYRINIAKLLRYGKIRNTRLEIENYVQKIAEGKRIGYR